MNATDIRETQENTQKDNQIERKLPRKKVGRQRRKDRIRTDKMTQYLQMM
jgi:hypothetical protein